MAKTAMKKNKKVKAPVSSKTAAKSSASKAPAKEAAKKSGKSQKFDLGKGSSAKDNGKKDKKLKPLTKIMKAVAKVIAAKPVKDDAKSKKSLEKVPASDKVEKPAKVAKSPVKAEKISKKKKKSDEFSLDDDLLASDEEIGSEEIPDLSEFDESETAEMEDDTSDDLTDGTVWGGELKPVSDEEVILTDAEGRRYCRVRDCDQIGMVEGYCRHHYLLLWKKIQVRRKILADGKLERYVEELTSRYPDKFLEMIRKDLRTEKDFLVAIAELEIDESAGDGEFEDETQNYIDEVRGITPETGISDEEEF